MGKFFNIGNALEKLADVKFVTSRRLWKHWAPGKIHMVGGKEISTKKRLQRVADTISKGVGSLEHNLSKVEQHIKKKLTNKRERYIPNNADIGIYKDRKTGLTALFTRFRGGGGHVHKGMHKLKTVYPPGMKVSKSKDLKYWDINKGEYTKY